MERFKIYDGRASFWQWDLEQKIVVPDGIADEVHFSNEKHDQAPVCDVYELDGVRLVNVPNIMLQDALPLTVYAYAKDDKGERTTYADVFTVTPRAKPEDYVYTETEVKTWDALDERITKLENSGGVDHEAVKNAVEDYLAANPIQETDPTVPEWAKQPEKPTYTAEEVGALPANTEIPKVDLTDYVKNTDYATSGKAGVVKISGGIGIKTDGALFLHTLSDGDVQDKKNVAVALQPCNIDEIVRTGITANGIALSDYEKQAAKDWLGVTEGGSGIPIDTAEVGQTIVVKAVDENGKPTEWEAADLPSGGGGAEWKLIGSTTTEEEVSEVAIINDKPLNEILVYYSIPPIPADTGGTTYAMPKIYDSSSSTSVSNLHSVNVSLTKPSTKTVRSVWYITPLIIIRYSWSDSQYVAPNSVLGSTENAILTIRDAYKKGGGLAGFCLNWNLGNKLPAGITLEVWGR